MHTHSVLKYGFRIRTRSGVLVENLSIGARDEQEAKRKLLKMYNDCEILEARCQQVQPGGRNAHYNYEDVMDLIIAS